MKKKNKSKKSRPLKLFEYYTACLFFYTARILPLKFLRLISNFIGDLLFFLSEKRRNISIDNLTHAFKDNKSDDEIKKLARRSCRELIFTFLEIIKLRYMFENPKTMEMIHKRTKNVDALFQKAKEIHDEAGGCIFVTPHIGNWEMLPQVSSIVGIPLAIVARPLENEYLEKLVYANRIMDGQIIIPKKNALFTLQKTLQKGTSIGMLPDQSTAKGIEIDFFGRRATATPVPAILAITYNRPIVVVACCRKHGDYEYDGFVSDPIRPGEYTSEKEEIFRITNEMTREMELIIRKHPEQYLWIHNRWKTYKGKKEFLS